MKRSRLLLISLVLLLVLPVVGACAKPPAPPPPAPDAIPVPNRQMPTIVKGSGVYGGSQQQGIWVSGTGEVTVTPDIATLQLSSEAQEASVAEAFARSSEAMDKIMKALSDGGLAEKDIQTQYFRVRQRTDWDREKQEEIIVGYQVTNTVVARIRDIGQVGAIIAAVVEAGGDLIRINRLDFSVDDPSVYYEEAREKAVADAKAKAERLAELAGLTLGPPTFVSEFVQQTRYGEVYYSAGMAGGPVPAPAPAPPPSISPGEMKVSLSVQVAYGILQ